MINEENGQNRPHGKLIHDVPLPLCGVQRFEKFLKVKDHLDDESYWQALRRAFLISDNLFNYQKEVKMAFQERREGRSEYLMNENEKEEFDDLPDLIKICRPMNLSEFQSKQFGVIWYDYRCTCFWNCNYTNNSFWNCNYMNSDYTNNRVHDCFAPVILETTVSKFDLAAIFHTIDNLVVFIHCKSVTNWGLR